MWAQQDALKSARQGASRRRERGWKVHSIGSPFKSCAILLLLAPLFVFASPVVSRSVPRITSQMHKNQDLLRQVTADLTTPSNHQSQRKASVVARIDYVERKDRYSYNYGGNEVAIGRSEYSQSMPERVRIVPFDLFLAPTPVQLQRGDEDLLLVELQELIGLFIQSQLHGGEYNASGRYGRDTTVEYVLFSDIETNSWTEGGNGPNDTPRTILRFNGGVASFMGEHIPDADTVNHYVKLAVDELFAPALQDTHYQYIQSTKYMEIGTSQEITDYNPIRYPYPDQPSIEGHAFQQTQESATVAADDDELTLVQITIVTVTACALAILAIVLWVRRNNRAVRILCLSSKDKEEIIDFSDHPPLTFAHSHPDKLGYTDDTSSKTKRRQVASVTEEDSESVVATAAKEDQDANDEDDDTWVNAHTQHLKNRDFAHSVAEEASLHSEFTIPTVSGASTSSASRFRGLSFSSHNPFKKSYVPQESFQKDRFANLSKDMLFSAWAGKAPNLDLLNGPGHDTVLKPSYFSAAKEREAEASASSGSSHSVDSSTACDAQSQPSVQSSETQSFKFAPAHENEGAPTGDGFYKLTKTPQRRSRKKGAPPRPEDSVPKRVDSDLV